MPKGAVKIVASVHGSAVAASVKMPMGTVMSVMPMGRVMSTRMLMDTVVCKNAHGCSSSKCKICPQVKRQCL